MPDEDVDDGTDWITRTHDLKDGEEANLVLSAGFEREEVELMELKLANAHKAASPRKYRLTPITPRKSRSSSNSPRSSPHSPKVRSAPFGAASDSPERRPQSS